MMKMVLTPRRNTHIHHIPQGDRRVRYLGTTECDVHVPLDIKEEKDAFVIFATVPGLAPDDLDIEIHNNALDLRGEFKKEINEDETYLRSERPSGKFRRFLRFPTKLDAAKTEAKLENGILTLRVPKVETEVPKSIKVSVK